MTTSMTVPVTASSFSFSSSIAPHARSYCARFLERISVEQDLVVIDFHHGAFINVAVVEVFDGGVDGCEEFLRAANVVNGNLGGFIGGHMLGAPNCV